MARIWDGYDRSLQHLEVLEIRAVTKGGRVITLSGDDQTDPLMFMDIRREDGYPDMWRVDISTTAEVKISILESSEDPVVNDSFDHLTNRFTKVD